MPYTIELDITHETPIEMVQQFATEHGCRVLSRLENGPAGGNPLYTFASDNFDHLQELAEQVFGVGFFDEETIKTMILEV